MGPQAELFLDFHHHKYIHFSDERVLCVETLFLIRNLICPVVKFPVMLIVCRSMYVLVVNKMSSITACLPACLHQELICMLLCACYCCSLVRSVYKFDNSDVLGSKRRSVTILTCIIIIIITLWDGRLVTLHTWFHHFCLTDWVSLKLVFVM